jgi:hypothetical protein
MRADLAGLRGLLGDGGAAGRAAAIAADMLRASGALARSEVAGFA